MVFKLLIHVNEPEKWPSALAGINNFLKDVGDNHAAVIVVANGAGVRGFIKKGSVSASTIEGEACSASPGADIPAMEALSARGVAFLACKNALKAQDILIEQLPAFVNVIPAGITEMVRLQSEGFAYIKP